MSKTSPLFSVTYFLLKAATILCFLAAGLLLLCLLGLSGVMLTNLADALEIPALLEGVPRNQVLAVGLVALAGGFIYVLLAMLVFILFTKIVETAMTGDPFVAQNADRLTKAGWLLLATYGVGIVTGIAALGMVPAKLMEKAGEDAPNLIHIDNGNPSPVGLLSILLIFVLAQIFRRGAEMRAELEGTV
jgi:hypothetical protein